MGGGGVEVYKERNTFFFLIECLVAINALQ